MELVLQRLLSNAASNTKTAVTFLSGASNGGKVEKQLTYEQLERETSNVAQKLLKAGIQRGDR